MSTLPRETHTHTHPFNGPLSGTTRVSRYQKGKTNRIRRCTPCVRVSLRVDENEFAAAVSSQIDWHDFVVVELSLIHI